MATETQVEFATEAWMEVAEAAVRECLVEAGEAAAGIDFSISELYTQPPAAFSTDDPVGWTCRISGGVVQFRREPADDVVVRIEADYATVIEIARFVVGGDAERQVRFDAMGAAAVEAGKIQVTGDLQALPEALALLHDKIAARTA